MRNDIPSAIIFVNNDLTPSIIATLTRQLFLSDVMTGSEFDNRVAADPNYPTIIHLNGMRILVMRSFRDQTNRNLADVAIFIKAGLASIEFNKVGPPAGTISIDRMYVQQLLTAPPAVSFPSSDGYFNTNIGRSPLLPIEPEPLGLGDQALYPFGTDVESEGVAQEDIENLTDDDNSSVDSDDTDET